MSIIKFGAFEINDVIDIRWQKTVLTLASEAGHVDYVKIFIENGADVNHVTRHKKTALMLAAQNGHADVVKVLIQNGADVNHADKDEWRAIHFAAYHGYVEIAKLLLQNGADVNAVTKGDIWTPLHIACQSYCPRVADVLLKYGADVNAVFGDDNRTALHTTARLGKTYYSLMLRLVWYGAKITRSAIAVEKSGVLRKIDDGLRELNRTKIPNLMNDKEKRYTWNLAFVLAKTYPGNAVKIYYSVLPFISFYGMFMEPKPKNRQ